MSQLAELIAAIRAGSTLPWVLRHGAPWEAFPRLYAAEQHADVLIRLLALCGYHPGDVIDKAFREPLDEEQPPLDLCTCFSAAHGFVQGEMDRGECAWHCGEIRARYPFPNVPW